MPVNTASDLNVDQVECLIEMLKRFKRAMGWTITDIIGIPPGIFLHIIQLMPDHEPSIDHQRWLNPHMQKVVKRDY